MQNKLQFHWFKRYKIAAKILFEVIIVTVEIRNFCMKNKIHEYSSSLETIYVPKTELQNIIYTGIMTF